MIRPINLICSVFLCIPLYFLFSLPAQAVETNIYSFQLTPSKPFIDTGINLTKDDFITIKQDSNSPIYVPAMTVPWITTGGDPGCLASSEFLLSGVNCWSLISKIGEGSQPFFVGPELATYSPQEGRLYLAINFSNSLLGSSGGWRVKVIHNHFPPPPTPTPFLDLPWDYQSKGMSFGEAATAINSYFDHEYPLLSASLVEPEETDNTTIIYDSLVRTIESYSSHDGYDYGLPAQTKTNEPILAPASGCATYGFNPLSGHHIKIDHGNFYQTRYYHLQPDQLITQSQTTCVLVSKGDQIGLVGFSGNVSPSGEAGSHLHFMVVEDKNQDGNFNDNIPDGVTDPFGWHGEGPDPWAEYNFTYNGLSRVGNDSHYLWIHPIEGLVSEYQQPQPQTFQLDDYQLLLPQDFSDKPLKVKMTYSHIVNLSDSHRSIKPGVLLQIFDHFGTFLTQFEKAFTLKINFSDQDLEYFIPQTLTIYSSDDGINWQPEETLLDLNTQTASAQIDHLSYFALIGELKDTTPANTTLQINDSNQLQSSYSGSVNISLLSQDNQDGLGIEYTAYRFDEDDWSEYQQPITFSTEGEHTIHYYSEDKAGNVENYQSHTFTITNQPPEFSLQLNPITLKPTFIATGSGQLSQTTQHIFGPIYKLSVSDVSNNQIELKYKHYQFKSINQIQLLTIQYNQQEVVTFPDNAFTTITGTIFGKPKIIQNWYQNQLSTTLIYNSYLDKTFILTSNPFTSNSLIGAKFLRINSNQGKLEISY